MRLIEDHPYDTDEFKKNVRWDRRRKEPNTKFYWVLVENGHFPKHLFDGAKKWYWMLEGEKVLCTKSDYSRDFYLCRPSGRLFIEIVRRGIDSEDLILI